MKLERGYYGDGKNCPGCNWEVNYHYRLKGIVDNFVCADCILEEIYKGDYQIMQKE